MPIEFNLENAKKWHAESAGDERTPNLPLSLKKAKQWQQESAPSVASSQQSQPTTLPFPTGRQMSSFYPIPVDALSKLQKEPLVRNFEGGVLNDLGHVGNLGLTGAQKLSQLVTGHPRTIHPSIIPKMKADEHSWPYIGGEGATFFLPFGVAAKGIEGAGALAGASRIAANLVKEKKPALAALSRLGGRVGTATGAGAVAGGATTDPGHRGMGALLGGAGGGGGELIGQGVGFVGRQLRDTGAINKLKEYGKHMLEVAQTPGERLINAIGDAYIRVRNKSQPLYNKVFGALKKSKAGMKGEDFKHYRSVRAQDLRENIQPPKEAIRPENLLTNPEVSDPMYSKIFNILRGARLGMSEKEFPTYNRLRAKDLSQLRPPPFEATGADDLATDYQGMATKGGTEEGDSVADSEKVHHLARDLFQLGRGIKNDPYTVYANALKKDLLSFLGRHKALKPYQEIMESENFANPARVHELQSKLRTIGETTGSIQHKQYGEAIRKDLVNFLKRHNLHKAYEEATAKFKQDVAPFLEHADIRKHIIPKIESEIEFAKNHPVSKKEAQGAFDSLGNYKRKFLGIDDVRGESHNIAKRLVPAAGEGDMKKLDTIEKILGHLPNNEAMHHARDMIFAHTLRYEPTHGISLPDINAAVTRYDQMGKDQIAKLFTKEEKKMMDTFKYIKKHMPKRNLIADASTRLLGTLIGHHALGLPGGVMGYAAAPEVGRLMSDMAAEMGTRDPERLMQRIMSKGRVPRSKVSGALASSLLHQFGQRD